MGKSIGFTDRLKTSITPINTSTIPKHASLYQSAKEKKTIVESPKKSQPLKSTSFTSRKPDISFDSLIEKYKNIPKANRPITRLSSKLVLNPKYHLLICQSQKDIKQGIIANTQCFYENDM